VIELVRELAKVRPDAYIATTLNRLGYLTGPGNTWTEIRVRHLRNYHQIPVFVKAAQRPWISATEAAKELNVGVGVIHTMIRNRTLPARQIVEGAPWMIRAEDLQQPEVQLYIKAARPGKAAPRGDDAQSLIQYQ
jgi:excisionase family DNA binding protein